MGLRECNMLSVNLDRELSAGFRILYNKMQGGPKTGPKRLIVHICKTPEPIYICTIFDKL